MPPVPTSLPQRSHTTQSSPLLSLPRELRQQINTYLDPKSLLSVEATCKDMAIDVDSTSTKPTAPWRPHCEALYNKQQRSLQLGPPYRPWPVMPPPAESYKSAYRTLVTGDMEAAALPQEQKLQQQLLAEYNAGEVQAGQIILMRQHLLFELSNAVQDRGLAWYRPAP